MARLLLGPRARAQYPRRRYGYQDGEAPYQLPNAHSRRNNNGNGQSLFSRQSLMVLSLGILFGYLLLPVLLVNRLDFNDLPASQYSKPPTAFDGMTTPMNSNNNIMVNDPPITSSSRVRGNGKAADIVIPTMNKDKRNLTPSDAKESKPKASNKITPANNKEGLSKVEQRLVEENNILASQSLPTSNTPRVMKTPFLPDHMRKKVLVTGGAGFVGSHLVDKLMMEGHEVIVVDNFFTGQKKNIAHWLHHPNFSLVVHDVTEPIQLEVDQIYHLACPASPPHYQYNPVKTIKTSTMGTLNMLGLAKRVRARILLTSTSEIYGDPQVHPQPESYWGNVNTIGPRSCYDEGKRVAETMMYSYRNQNGVEVRVARIFNTFGPRMHPNDGRVVSNFIIQSLQKKDMTIYGNGEQTRSFQYVSDLVNGLHKLMNGDYDLPVNLGNPDEFSVTDFAKYIKKMTNSTSEIVFLEKSQDDPSQRRPDITCAKEKIEWEPQVTVEDGLKDTISYFRRVLEEAGEIIPTGPGAAKPEA